MHATDFAEIVATLGNPHCQAIQTLVSALAGVLPSRGSLIPCLSHGRVFQFQQVRYSMPNARNRTEPKYIGEDIVAAWYLWDYKLQQIGQADRKFMSMKQLSQFSCQSHTTQLLSVAMYVEKMAIGAPVAKANFKDQPWVNIAPQSAREVIFKYLCINK